MPEFKLPNATRYIIRNARMPRALADDAKSQIVDRVDIVIEAGRIGTIRPAGAIDEPGLAGIDLDDGLVLPGFVDMHTHLDKGHIWPRRPNPDGTFMSALNAVAADRERFWRADDVARRMDFALRTAYAHGTVAIRTHLDSAPPQDDITWDVFEAARERWKGKVALQAVALLGPDHLFDRATLKSVAARAEKAGGLLGGAISSHPRMAEAMRNLVEAAGDAGLDLDLHCDETADANSDALASLAEAVIETGFSGRVVAGHCCALALKDDAIARREIEKVAQAGIAVVSLPMCNMYLQDRSPNGRTPRWRGVAPLTELQAAGVPIAIASDNTRDPFYAYGDLDCLEVLREGIRILHFDHPAEAAWPFARCVAAGAAAIAGFDDAGRLGEGLPADLLLFRARTLSELMSRPQSERIVIRNGRAIDTTLPDYRELDDLMEP